MKSRIMYVERKADGLTGPARIGRVTFSQTGRTLYYGGQTFVKVRGYKYNHMETGTGAEYWISGCKRDGTDRLYDERNPVRIDEDARDEYWTQIREHPELRHVTIANRLSKVRVGAAPPAPMPRP
jgi:hypothetical protein